MSHSLQAETDKLGGVIFRNNRYIAPMIKARACGKLRKLYKWELRRG